MSRAGIFVIALLGAVGLFAAIAGGVLGGGPRSSGLLATAVAQEAGTNPPPVVGDLLDCPPTGPGPEDVRARFDIDGSAFEVTGALRSFDGVTLVVAGPSGDVTATLAASFELKGDLSPGQPVNATGTAADDGSMTIDKAESACLAVGVVECDIGGDPRLRLKIEGSTFELTGRLDSLNASSLSVAGPGLLVEANIDSATRLGSGLKVGDTVTVKGIVLDTKALLAQEVISACGSDAGALVAASPPARRGAAGSDDCKGASDAHRKSRAKIKHGEVKTAHGRVRCSVAADDEHGKHCNETDANRGHGNDCDHNDEDNPGHGGGADDNEGHSGESGED